MSENKSKKNQVVKIDELEKRIAQFTTIEDFIEGKDQLQAVKVFASKKRMERSLIQRLNAGSIRIAWEIGGILKDVLVPHRHPEGEKPVTLDDMGISKSASHRYQTINNIPKTVFEDRINELIAIDADVTERDFYKFAKALETLTVEKSEVPEEDGTDRMEAEKQIRDDFIELAKEQIAEIRKKGIKALENLTDKQIDLMMRAILEVVTDGSSKVKNKVVKFLGDNALDETNYWSGLSIAVRQMKAVYSSLNKNTNPSSPKAFLHFVQNIKSMVGLLESWDEKKLSECPACKGTGKIATPQGHDVLCDMCLNGKIGWYKE